MAECNVQALKSKQLQVSELLHDYSIDILLMTETWLADKDQYWIDSCEFNKNSFNYTQNTGGKDGEVVVMDLLSLITK